MQSTNVSLTRWKDKENVCVYVYSIRCVLYIFYYSAAKKIGIVWFTSKYMELGGIRLSEISQTQIDATCSALYVGHKTKK